MKENLNKKEHKLYTLFTIKKVILLGKQTNTSTIVYLLIYSHPISLISVVMAKD